MSSAANHRARSCRSAKRHRSAMRGQGRTSFRRSVDNKYGAHSASLIYRLQAFARRMTENRKKSTEGTGDE